MTPSMRKGIGIVTISLLCSHNVLAHPASPPFEDEPARVENEPNDYVCGSKTSNVPWVRILGQKGDLLQLNFKDQTLYYNPDESRGWMGDGRITCNDVMIEKDIMVVAMGREGDMAMFYAFDYDKNGNVSAVWRYAWPRRPPGHVTVGLSNRSAGGGDVVASLQVDHTIATTRFCFDKTRHVWRQYHDEVHPPGLPPKTCDKDLPTELTWPPQS